MSETSPELWDSREPSQSVPILAGRHASPLSFSGATYRLTSWAERTTVNAGQAENAFRWVAAGVAMSLMYLVVASWYSLLALNVLAALFSFAFTVILFPLLPFSMAWLFVSLAPFGFRSHRKTQRQDSKTLADQLAALQSIQKNTNKE